MKVKKYSLRWWFDFGRYSKQHFYKNNSHAKKLSARLAFKLGYWAAQAATTGKQQGATKMYVNVISNYDRTKYGFEVILKGKMIYESFFKYSKEEARELVANLEKELGL